MGPVHELESTAGAVGELHEPVTNVRDLVYADPVPLNFGPGFHDPAGPTEATGHHVTYAESDTFGKGQAEEFSGTYVLVDLGDISTHWRPTEGHSTQLTNDRVIQAGGTVPWDQELSVPVTSDGEFVL